jgi:hypothetical protein
MVNIYVMNIKEERGLNLLNGKSMWEYRRRKNNIINSKKYYNL